MESKADMNGPGGHFKLSFILTREGIVIFEQKRSVVSFIF